MTIGCIIIIIIIIIIICFSIRPNLSSANYLFILFLENQYDYWFWDATLNLGNYLDVHS